MEYSKLLDLATDLGYELAMSGAETYRVEESVTRVLKAYDIDAEVFVIPNCMHISIEPVLGRPLTRMRRIGAHDSDLDAVENFSALSRRLCREKPAPEIAARWLEETKQKRRHYPLWVVFAGYFLGAFGFTFLFGGSWVDGIFSGLSGLIVGLVNMWFRRWGSNDFFRIIIAAFLMALAIYGAATLGIVQNPDAATIGALMLLVPGLLFTNAMRDIIFGDTNSGINRIVQVLLTAIALALGTAAAWNCVSLLWPVPSSAPDISYGILIQSIPSFVACIGFAILFNIHGPGGLLCALGGVFTWLVYLLILKFSGNDLTAYFFATVFAAAYSEILARIRKCPAIAYLVLSIFPLIPGAGAYYTMHHAVQGEMDQLASVGMHTAAIAGVMAVGILLVSTVIRMINLRIARRRT